MSLLLGFFNLNWRENTNQKILTGVDKVVQTNMYLHFENHPNETRFQKIQKGTTLLGI